MRERFKGDDRYHFDIRPHGLWIEDGWFRLGNYETDGASILSEKEPRIMCMFRDYRFQIRSTIDLALMNIEGAEYTLLPSMIKGGFITSFSNFWCQFHPGSIPDPDSAKTLIFEGMEKTHEMIWNCYPTAVAWRLK